MRDETKRTVKQYLRLAGAVALTLAAGGLASLLSGDIAQNYGALQKPPLSPPGIVFPVVWTILYVLMGVSLWRIWESNAPRATKNDAAICFFCQLAVNVAWPILFFRFSARWAAFGAIAALILLIALTMRRFRAIDSTAARLLFPYLLWTLFASYLNFGTAILN